jgi:hypothetical protein
VLDSPHVVGIVVDPSFGDRVDELLQRLPLWIADTEGNRAAIKRVWTRRRNVGESINHTDVGALTSFTVEPNATPEAWFIGVMNDVAGHHDRYSHLPGYSAVEVYGVTPSAALLAILGEYRLTVISSVPGGFRASTADGEPASSPNDA